MKVDKRRIIMPENIVEVASGKLRGMTEGGVYSFKGIPYGGPTGGKNRFKPPSPARPWNGIKDATRYGPASWQPITSPIISYLQGESGVDSIGEDCLVLNVWTPGLNDNKKRPVMVWLHGGGFFYGSGDHLPCFNGASLANKGDVVLVSVNHRLGVLGYLYLDELGGKEYAGSGNAGMLDLVLALKWVRDNIAAFGGDPDKVTIFGESGGGTKVSTLMAMPSAKGLFHRAIIESGPGLRAHTPEDATSYARSVLNFLEIMPEQIHRLQELRASMIFSAGQSLHPKGGGGTPPGTFSPVVDGTVLPGHPFDPAAPPTAASIPLLIGSNKDEATYFMKDDPRFGKYDEATMRQMVIDTMKQRIGAQRPIEKVEELIATYQRTRPGATPHDTLIAIYTDLIRIGSIWIAERQAAGSKAPVYMYLFTWESPAHGGALKSPHTAELPFVFNNVERPIELVGNSPERFAMADNISSAWIAFARNGNPNHRGIPLWPTYTAEKRPTMILNTQCRVQEDPYSEEREAWNR
jgi:para-nitrobenzyl esterase